MKRKVAEKLKAIALRKKGYSVNEIVKKLSVAKSSVSVWVRNVPLNKIAEKRLLTKIQLGQWRAAELKRAKTRKLVEMSDHNAQKIVDHIIVSGALMKVFCGILYWCEGAKNPMGGVRFTNSDPNVIKTFLVLLRNSFLIDEQKLRIGLHLHEYHDIKKQIDFWSTITQIPTAKFIKPFLKHHTKKRIRENYPGCATVYYYQTSVARELLSLGKAFLKNVGA